MTTSERYDHTEIETRWQARWESDHLYRQQADPSRPKHYAVTMLPYPSGDLHIGHWYAMSPSDARARYMRMRGYNVLFPMGFDAFGLPAENAAIKRNIHPKTWTFANIEKMRGQMQRMGAMFDWEREAISADPEYYRWTQWFFQMMVKTGLAYKKLAAVDFCPNCNTTLAREQVWGEDRHCERCGTPVIKKHLNQWFFRITKYADELLDFSTIDWPERVQTMQTHWIGRSEGAEVVFTTETGGHQLPVFTTRPDTLWGATFMVMAPEHPLVNEITTAAQRAAVEAYITASERISDIDREAIDREKTGVFTGGYAINPVNNERIPIWVADYVMMTYGSGAIMAVPAHDERDFAFARKYGLEVRVVIQPEGDALDGASMPEAVPGAGVMVNSDHFNGQISNGEKGRKNPAIAAVIDWLAEKGTGKEAVNYRLRDWLISRQRYWGAPIPMVTCPTCGIVAVPDDQLPVLLPDDVEFMPTGESPLKSHPAFLHTDCPQCGGPAERETDTLDTFMCSSWYQFRYLSPHDSGAPFDAEEAAYWLPVDQYTGGIEHATMHLLYTRFFSKAMRDSGFFDHIQPTSPNQLANLFNEPMTRLFNQGIILGEDREKMSKSRGNVVAPDALVELYGADVVRCYLMFAFKWDQGGPWDSQGILGPQRFVQDVWRLVIDPPPGANSRASDDDLRALRRKVHQTILRVTDGLDRFSFNTSLAALMELKNTMQKTRTTAVARTPAWNEAVRTLLLLLAPFTPHITEELWAKIGGKYSIHQQAWPVADVEAAKEDVMNVGVQVNGKVRARIEVDADTADEEVKALALNHPDVQKWLNDQTPQQVVYVKGRLVSIVL